MIDPYSAGALIAPAFAASGATCIAVTTDAAPPPALAGSWRPQDFEEVLVFDGDLDGLIRNLRARRLSGVVVGVESGSGLADRLCQALYPHLANDLALSDARRNKAMMHDALADAGVTHLRQIWTDDYAQVEKWLADTGLDLADAVIVKPARSAGTDAVRRFRPGPELRAAFESMVGRRNAFGEIEQRVLVQEYATGVEYSVDTFTEAGHHNVCGITRYTKRTHGSVVGIYDTVEFLGLDDPACRKLVPYARAVLDALGVRFGPMHSEIVLGPDRPVLIELNARMAGGQMVFLSRLATGDSQLDRLTRYFSQEPTPAADYVLERHAMSVFVTAHRAGIVGNPQTLSGLANLPTAKRSTVPSYAGMSVTATEDVFTVLGRVVLADPDRRAVEADRKQIKLIEHDLQIR